jgi:hypothetical protein
LGGLDLDRGWSDLRIGGAEVEEGEGSRREEKGGGGRKIGRGRRERIGCAAPPLAAATIHQHVEATTVRAPWLVVARMRVEVTSIETT